MDRARLVRLGHIGVPLGCAAAIVTPLVTHTAIVTGRFATAATVLAMVEVVVLAALALRRLRGRLRAAGAVGSAILLALLAMRLVRPAWAGLTGLMATSGVSHAFIYVTLLLLFGRSLQPGNTPLVTGLATRIRGTLTPAMLVYTRNVTMAWCVFFVAQLALSAGLLLLAPHRVWSLFVNVLDLPCLGLMFAGEYAVRRWRFRGISHSSPMEGIRSFVRSRAART